MHCESLIYWLSKNSMSLKEVLNYRRATNSCATLGISRYAITTLSGIRVSFPRTVSPMKMDCNNEISSKVWVSISLLVSLVNPFPFFRSRRWRLGCGLVTHFSVSWLVVGAGAYASHGGGESVGRVLPSSSHVVIMSSSRRLFCGHGGGVKGALGKNNTMKYCCITGQSFFPVSKA